MRYVVIAALLALFLAGPANAQWIENDATEAAIQRGIQYTYNMEFAKAEREFATVRQSYPGHPAGYFLDAMVDWWRILVDFRNTSRDEAFVEKLDKVIDLCDRRLDKNEKDVAALFFKGGSLGFQGRLYSMRKDWVGTAGKGKNALPVVYEAEELAPGNADIQLGTGIYNYYAAVLPARYSALKPLMLFLPDGNKDRGIKYLKKAAADGKYAKYEAQYFLLQTYYKFENSPSKALYYARNLHKEFPNNPVFHRYIGRAYVQMGNWSRATAVFEEILDRVDKGMAGYNASLEREASYYVGYYAVLHRDYSKAVKYLVRCDRASRALDKSEPSGFMIMANLRLGMAHDGLEQRDYALKQYKKVLRMDDYSNSHELAHRYTSSPYGK